MKALQHGIRMAVLIMLDTYLKAFFTFNVEGHLLWFCITPL